MLYINFNYNEFNKKYYNNFINTIKNNYNINDITLEYPFYYIFKRRNYNEIVLNHKYHLIEIKKKGKRIGTNGRICYGKLLVNKKKIKYCNLFIKESPIICYNQIINFINYKNNNTNLLCNKQSYQIPSLIHSMNNPSYIHVFISYLLSKCVENNYIPHFPLFYGSASIIMNKYTYPMEKETFNNIEDEIDNLNNDEIKVFCYDDDEFFLELKNIPVILSNHEKIDYNLINLLSNKELSLDEWYSFLFQIFFSICFIQKHFNMIHNDLHIGNIMYKKTNNKYIYYFYNNRYYKIPTFNRIYIIIDWERSIFKYNNILYYNNVFLSNNDCSGQYYYNTYNSCNKKLKLPNYSFDITFLICSIMNFYDEESDLNLNNDIFNYFINILIDINGNIINYNNQSFYLYEYISNYSINGIPKNRLLDSIFKKFKVLKKDINDNIYF